MHVVVCVCGGGGGLVRKVLHYCCDSLKTELLLRVVSLVQETNVGQEKGVILRSHSVQILKHCIRFQVHFRLVFK